MVLTSLACMRSHRAISSNA